jgi:formyl-CoA transferase
VHLNELLRSSGYGQSGPYRDKPGFGVVAEAMGGLRHLTAEPGRTPVRVGVSIGDTLAALDDAQVPAGRIYTVADIAADPHYRARGMIERVTLADGSMLEVPGVVPKLSRTPGAIRSAAPALGEHDGELRRDGGAAALSWPARPAPDRRG